MIKSHQYQVLIFNIAMILILASMRCFQTQIQVLQPVMVVKLIKYLRKFYFHVYVRSRKNILYIIFFTTENHSLQDGCQRQQSQSQISKLYQHVDIINLLLSSCNNYSFSYHLCLKPGREVRTLEKLPKPTGLLGPSSSCESFFWGKKKNKKQHMYI